MRVKKLYNNSWISIEMTTLDASTLLYLLEVLITQGEQRPGMLSPNEEKLLTELTSKLQETNQ